MYHRNHSHAGTETNRILDAAYQLHVAIEVAQAHLAQLRRDMEWMDDPEEVATESIRLAGAALARAGSKAEAFSLYRRD